MKLSKLREGNSGYNPERAKDHGAKPVQWPDGRSYLVDRDNIYYIWTFCKTEEQYIQNFPKRFGLVHKGQFYAQEA